MCLIYRKSSTYRKDIYYFIFKTSQDEKKQIYMCRRNRRNLLDIILNLKANLVIDHKYFMK